MDRRLRLQRNLKSKGHDWGWVINRITGLTSEKGANSRFHRRHSVAIDRAHGWCGAGKRRVNPQLTPGRSRPLKNQCAQLGQGLPLGSKPVPLTR